jgi:hypothetical protein
MKNKWNEVTWFSKMVALVLFVALPFIGFYYGSEYGKVVASIGTNPMPIAPSTSTALSQNTGSSEYYSNVAEWQTDTNNTKGNFSIAYPIDFDQQDNYSATSSADWRTGDNGGVGIKYFSLVVPRAFEPQTNFGEATLTVGVGSTAGTVAKCSIADGTVVATSTATIGGQKFTMFHSGDAGAGNLYDTTSYRTLHGGKCYAIEYTLHSTQIAAYPSSYDLKPYDKKTVTSLMQNIIGTFKFTQ